MKQLLQWIIIATLSLTTIYADEDNSSQVDNVSESQDKADTNDANKTNDAMKKVNAMEDEYLAELEAEAKKAQERQAK